MHFAISQLSCPLCRRSLTDNSVGHEPGSRLCDQCRAIVQEAFPGPGRRPSISMAGVEANGAMTTIPHNEPALHLPPIHSTELIEDASSYESFEHEPEFPPSNSPESESRLMSDLPEDMDLNARKHTDEMEVIDVADNNSEGLHAAEQSAAVDPWEEPLPAWDYSQNEWPVLVGPPRRNPFGALRASLVALLLLAAAGFYFLVFRPALKDQRTSAPASATGAERTAAVANPNLSEAKPAEPGPSPVSPSPSPEAPALVDAKPIQVPDAGNAHGKFSLQAAAFPTQAGADEFAEKLKKAGVPSFVISADLGRRGTWFRVRVGRFNTADDAQKFAAEAQLRAKAAGMSLELIGCQYDQP